MRDIWKLPFAPTTAAEVRTSSAVFKSSDRDAARDSFRHFTDVARSGAEEAILVAKDNQAASISASRPLSYARPLSILTPSFNARVQREEETARRRTEKMATTMYSSVTAKSLKKS
jgi:hypothetical protein